MISLHYFQAHELKHPELCNDEALVMLDEIRACYDNPIVVTDDARTPAEVAARQNTLQGGSKTSLHALGRAFDLRWPSSIGLLFRLVGCITRLEKVKYKDRIELELDFTPGNEHVHVGLRPEATGSTLILRKVEVKSESGKVDSA